MLHIEIFGLVGIFFVGHDSRGNFSSCQNFIAEISVLLGVGYTGENFEFWVPTFFWIDITPTNSEEKEFLKNNKNSDFSALFYLPTAFFSKITFSGQKPSFEACFSSYFGIRVEEQDKNSCGIIVPHLHLEYQSK